MQLQFNFDPKQSRLEQAFWKFHDRNPEVYQALVEFSKEWRQGHGPGASLGVKKLFEQVRWEMHLGDEDEFPKLNNNHTAFYARLLMLQHPDLDGLFRLRQQRFPATFGPDNNQLPPNPHIVGP